MSRLSYSLMAAAVVCFGAAIITRLGEPRLYLFFSISQFFTLTMIFVLGAILTTLREYLSKTTTQKSTQK